MCLCLCRCVCVLSRCRCVCVCVCVDVFVFVSMCLCIVTVSMSKWVSVSLESPRLQPATRYSWQKTSAHCSAMSNVQSAVLHISQCARFTAPCKLQDGPYPYPYPHIHINSNIISRDSQYVHIVSGLQWWYILITISALRQLIHLCWICAPTYERSFLYRVFF